jgi:hypothetical protein
MGATIEGGGAGRDRALGFARINGARGRLSAITRGANFIGDTTKSTEKLGATVICELFSLTNAARAAVGNATAEQVAQKQAGGYFGTNNPVMTTEPHVGVSPSSNHDGAQLGQLYVTVINPGARFCH